LPKRPEFRNINAFTDLPTYRLPLAGMGVHPAPHQRRHDVPADAFHHLDVRHLGFLRDLVSPASPPHSTRHWLCAGWFIKLVALALIWAYLHH
jgi:succinate dehydrogenase / fumarate reductase cytochrome b subunit